MNNLFNTILEEMIKMIIPGVLAIIAVLIGKRRGIKILLQVGTLHLPIIIFAPPIAWITARVIVVFDPYIPVQNYASWLAGVVGSFVFIYTGFWYRYGKPWVEKTAPDVVEKISKSETKKDKEGEV